MVDEHAAGRTQRWVDEAVALGGKLLLGGQGRRHVLPADGPDRRPADGPGLLERGLRAARRRLPVPRLRRRDRAASTTRCFGLQTGVFTNDLAGAWRAFAELEVGGVIVNDVPTYRIDHMPYGGVKDSGLGREGLRWAIEDMTEIRIMVLAQPALTRATARDPSRATRRASRRAGRAWPPVRWLDAGSARSLASYPPRGSQAAECGDPS